MNLDQRKSSYWQEKFLVAFLAQSEVIVATMRPVSEELKLKRPTICRSNSVPSASFGYGLTPN